MRQKKGTPPNQLTPEQRAIKKKRNQIIQRHWMADEPHCFEMANRVKYESMEIADKCAEQLHLILGEPLMRSYWCFYSHDGVGHWHLTREPRRPERKAKHAPLDVIVGDQVVRVWCGPPAPQPYPAIARTTG